MAASREDVDRWIEGARKMKKTFIISVCDTFDWDDYPVYCENHEELLKRIPEFHNTNLQKINEIIQIQPNGEVVENLTPENFGTFMTTFIPKV